MPRSAMELLVEGAVLRAEAGHHAVLVSEKRGVWIRGCDCDAQMLDEDVHELHEVLGAYLRRRRNKEQGHG
ncbi:hypothetical protein ACJ6WD_10725 [Streptomyces sp. VTCC 41912]|uniref:hypothetical protein n=1 Tax=Streptomyces sp. VTCC 41912 TaxID=3383243 RepID=UPI003896E1F8